MSIKHKPYLIAARESRKHYSSHSSHASHSSETTSGTTGDGDGIPLGEDIGGCGCLGCGY